MVKLKLVIVTGTSNLVRDKLINFFGVFSFRYHFCGSIQGLKNKLLVKMDNLLDHDWPEKKRCITGL